MVETFRDMIAENKRKSFSLVVVFVLFNVVVAGVIGLAIVLYIDPELADEISWTSGILIGVCAALVSLFLAYLSYMAGDQLILYTNGAKPMQKSDDPQLFNVVEEIAIAAGIPMPSVYLIQDPAPNAFATGRDPEHASVAITTGLREKLNREELQGVIAHEISHIRNYDIRLMMLLAVLIGSVVMLADFFWQVMWFSGGRRSRSSSNNNKDGGGGWIVLIVVVLAILLAMIAPILAQIIQLAVSRQREYLADASAVELTRNPLGLANALRKIDADPHVLATANRGTAHLYIANPIKKFEARADSVFASHPPIEDRIRRLMALVHE
jgi:heat shock protein HtpX